MLVRLSYSATVFTHMFEVLARLRCHRFCCCYRLQVTPASIAVSPTVGSAGSSTIPVATSTAVLMLPVPGNCDTEPDPRVQRWRCMRVAGAVNGAFSGVGYQGVGGAYDRFDSLTLVSTGLVVLELCSLRSERMRNRVCCENFRRSVGASSMLPMTCDRSLVFGVVSWFEFTPLNCCSRAQPTS